MDFKRKLFYADLKRKYAIFWDFQWIYVLSCGFKANLQDFMRVLNEIMRISVILKDFMRTYADSCDFKRISSEIMRIYARFNAIMRIYAILNGF